MSKTESIDLVPKRQWQLGLALTGTVLLGGLVVVIVLAFGAANPPRAGGLQWQADSIEGWPLQEEANNFQRYEAPVTLPPPPFTLELTATNTGTAASAWGIQVGKWTTLINNEGYISATSSDKLDWAEFPHIRRNSPNKLYLHVAADGSATLRINDEIVTTGLQLTPENRWSVYVDENARLEWANIALYA